MPATIDQCIADCQTTHQLCLETVFYCLNRGGAHAGPDHIRMLLDCAAICATTADFMVRRSDFHTQTCRVCAAVCDACNRDCTQVDPNDEQMNECARQCRQCADSCQQMAA